MTFWCSLSPIDLNDLTDAESSMVRPKNEHSNQLACKCKKFMICGCGRKLQQKKRKFASSLMITVYRIVKLRMTIVILWQEGEAIVDD